MKKLLSVLAITAFLFTAPVAFAEGNCHGPECEQWGAFDMKAKAYDGGLEGDYDTTYKGFAGSGSAAGGATCAAADAEIEGEGDAYGYMRVSGGGIAYEEQGYEWWDHGQGSIEHGIGSSASAEAQTTATMTLEADADGDWEWKRCGRWCGYYEPTAEVEAEGHFAGVAGQGTISASAMGEAPIFVNDGFTGGIAAQASAGFIAGGVDVESYGDNRPDRDTASAEVYMNGSTRSHSWRGVETMGGYRTEYMGTRSVAYTNVTSDRYVSSHPGDSYAYGGFIAGGAAANMTVMEADNGGGYAHAAGAYLGAGELGCDFEGYANSKTNVSVTTAGNGSGSIVTSTAEATVSTNGESIPR